MSTDGRGDVFDALRGLVVDLPVGKILPGWVQKAAVIEAIDQLEGRYQPSEYDQTCEQCRNGGHLIPPPHRMAVP